MASRQAKASLEWVRHTRDPKERKAFERELLSARNVLERLAGLLREKQDASRKVLTDYSDASWSHKQADNNGFCRALDYVLTLIDIYRETN